MRSRRSTNRMDMNPPPSFTRYTGLTMAGRAAACWRLRRMRRRAAGGAPCPPMPGRVYMDGRQPGEEHWEPPCFLGEGRRRFVGGRQERPALRHGVAEIDKQLTADGLERVEAPRRVRQVGLVEP